MLAGLPPGTLLLWRLGDFYEIFGDGAKIAAPVLGVALTRRQDIPMAGIPVHAQDAYLARLTAAGLSFALATPQPPPGSDTLEDAGLAPTDSAEYQDVALDSDRDDLAEKLENMTEAAVGYHEKMCALEESDARLREDNVKLIAERDALEARLGIVDGEDRAINAQNIWDEAYSAGYCALPQNHPEQLAKLSPEEKRVRIAEACGATDCRSDSDNAYWPKAMMESLRRLGCHPIRSEESTGLILATLPNYLADLNAMFLAEKAMHDAESSAKWNEYMRHLNRICTKVGDEDVHATAAQRADAFLLCLP